MSSHSTSIPPSISKSAAKKRAKRAAATARTQPSQPPVTATATAEVRVDLGDALDPNDPNQLYLPPGAYPDPADSEFEPFFDDTEFPPGVHNGYTGHQSQSFPLPFLDYSVSPYNQHPHPFANLPPSVNITNEDLIQTANELYRRMADPKFASDDAYWSSLPAHIRNFIREAVPFSPGDMQANGTAGRDESIHTLAQRIVSVASQGMGLQGVGPNILNGSMPPPTRGAQPPPSQAGLARELGFHAHPDARDDDEYEEEDLDLDLEPGTVAANGDAPKKKNKKKKKKSANTADVPAIPASLPPVPPIKQPPPAMPHPQQPHQQQPPPATRPVLNPPPPPATNAPTAPLPSSRAAGKQPMTANPAANPPSRSARAAGKAPASAQSAHSQTHNHPPAKSANAKGKAPANAPPTKIWAQSSPEDREHIRAFWLELNEAERRDLLQIEKDAVLKKMKEQHRHSCGCAVCGRKKVNIEMELDQLYEQYYDELRSYAAGQKAAVNGQQVAPPGAGPFPGSVEVDPSGQVTKFDHRAPDRLPPEEYDDEGSDVYDDEEDEYDEEELEDDQSDEAEAGDELDEHQQPVARQARKAPAIKPPAPRPEGSEDFMNFGSNLATIKGGILTVADDLLKNDGTKFLEMMEQLAVARSVREEQNIRDMQVDTEDDDYDKDEPLTEAERMEEGKRMFQICAARMFEQRVHQAYKEKVAKQREEQLLRELDEEEDSKRAKEEKRAKEAQKKKDKKKLQKQRADEEKAARDAALAEEQRAAKQKAAELERERQKKAEEERARREAVKKAAAEDAARKEAERKKRQQEEREREEEAKRKRLEAQEKARKEKEAREKETKEKERKEREEKAAKDKAEKERIAKDKAEKDRLAKEKAEKDRLAKLEEEKERERVRKEEEAKKERAAAEQSRQRAEEQARQQASQRAREAKDQAAAAERAAAAEASTSGRLSASAEKNRSTPTILARPPSIPQVSGPIPLNQPSPIKAAASSSSSMNRGQSGPFPSSVGSGSKSNAQPFLSQPIPSMSYQPRVQPIGQNLAPGYRPAYPSQSPVFSPPANGGPSPAPQTSRAFPEPSPPFDHIRSAPIGMGFPPPKNRPAPIGSMDDFSPPPIGSRALSSAGASSDLPTQLNALSLLNESSTSSGPSQQQSFGMPTSAPAPIGPPKAAPMPIGRPAFHDHAHSHAPASATSAAKSPNAPVQVLGSAALGSDDDVIVQPARRNTSNGWDIPATGSGALGGSRWSTAPSAPSIWGNSTAATAPNTAPVNSPAQVVHDNADALASRAPHPHWSRTPYMPAGGTGAGAPGSQPRQGSLSGLGGGTGPFGAAPGSNPFGPGVNLFAPPPATGQQQQSQAHSQHHHR